MYIIGGAMRVIFFIFLGGITLFMLNACKNPTQTTFEFTANLTTKNNTESTTVNTTTTNTVNEEPVNLYYEEHTIVHRIVDFNKGELNDLTMNSNGLILKDGVLTGTYTSPIINTKTFKELVASWNALTPDTSNVELKIQIRQNGSWSQWFSYGKWGLEKANRSISTQADVLAKMTIDTIIIKNGFADGYRYMISLNRNGIEDESPVLKLIAQTLALENQSVETINLSEVNWQTDIEVPIHSQMLVPTIGNIICSPTSLTMLMNHYGINFTPSETAAKAKDFGANIYGNWSFNVAVAGSLGLESYVSRLENIDELKLLISQNIPVVVSITVKDAAQLDNLPKRSDGTTVMTYPGGHLLVVRGFTVIDNVEYVIVNDPAARNNEEVNRQYKLDQFENIWKNYVYIIQQP
jgi:hypothetical protein